MKEYTILKNVDLYRDSEKAFKHQCNRKNLKNLSIAFIISELPKGGGGQTSILRLGTYLKEFGHNVSYISYKSQRNSKLIANAKWNVKDFKGKILNHDALNKLEIDIGIATYWISAYYLWNMRNVKYKAYFIQDYEPDFYPAGDIRAFVENTYRMGYHMISLGSWNKRRIKENIGASIDAIVFPYEPGEYGIGPGWESKFTEKRVINICAYLKRDEKRGGILLLQGLEQLYRIAKARHFDLRISFFGEDKRLKYPIAIPYKNLGKLSKEKLKKLYNESDFGIVFSYTNISLIPLEMMACGCPVLEVNDGSFRDFFMPECAILVDSYPQDFVKKAMYYIEHPEEKKQIAENAMASLTQRTWRQAAQQFRRIILEGYKGTIEFSI